MITTETMWQVQESAGTVHGYFLSETDAQVSANQRGGRTVRAVEVRVLLHDDAIYLRHSCPAEITFEPLRGRMAAQLSSVRESWDANGTTWGQWVADVDLATGTRTTWRRVDSDTTAWPAQPDHVALAGRAL